MKIILWTESPPKLAAIREAIKNCPYFQGQNVEMSGLTVASGVSNMPLTLEETMNWAQKRALNARELDESGDFYIWMEWWTNRIGDKSYLFGTVYIMNREGIGHFWFSNMMEVPDIFDKKLYQEWQELGNILEEMTGIDNISKKHGAFGVWSDNMLSRKDQFMIAFMSAIPAFYNQYYR